VAAEEHKRAREDLFDELREVQRLGDVRKIVEAEADGIGLELADLAVEVADLDGPSEGIEGGLARERLGRILEGERGFFRATSTGYDPSRVTDRLGEQWKITENCYKLHSCCAHTHTAIDVALDIRARHGWTAGEALDAIARVDLET